MPSERQYHAIVRGEQQGPFTREEMVDLARRGEITPETMAWTEGMTVWRALPEVPGMHNLLAGVPESEAPATQPPTPEPMLPASVESALDNISRPQAYVIGAGIFYALIAILGIGSIFTFRRLALLGFWGSAALAFFAYRAWQQERDGQEEGAAGTAFIGAIGSWVLAVVSLVFGNFFFGILQAGAGLLFWLARTELLKQQRASVADATEAADGLRPTADGSVADEASASESDPPVQDPTADV